MRTLPDNLLAEQLKSSYMAALWIQVGDFAFTLDESSTCSNIKEVNPDWTSIPGGRILKTSHLEEPYRASATILLNDSDKLLTGVDLKGESLAIGYGMYVDDEPIYSLTAPLRVKSHRNDSSEGKLVTELTCFGVMQELDDDKAVEKFTGDTETVKTLIQYVLQPQDNSFAPFLDYPDFILVFDSEDSLIDSVVPGSGFTIKTNETRLQAIAKLFTHTYCVIRPGNEEPDINGKRTLHIFKPKTSGSFDYDYSLSSHTFWAKSSISSLVVPNYIIVKTPEDVTPSYSGYAKDVENYNKYPSKITEHISGLTSDGEASEVAQAILSNVQQAEETAATSVPMNCGAEVYDWVKVVDTREGTEVKGNIGVLRRSWDSSARGIDKFPMSFSFGGWLSVEKISKLLFLTGGETTTLGETINPCWVEPGNLSTGATNKIMPVPRPNLTGIWAQAITPSGDGPTGADLIIDIEYNGTTIFTNQDRRLKILNGQTYGIVYLDEDETDVVTYAFEGNWTMSIDQVGSTQAGANLTVVLVTEVA